jgi:hypothetical protein
VKPDEIQATYKKGILEVHILVPKAEKPEVKKVTIAWGYSEVRERGKIAGTRDTAYDLAGTLGTGYLM